MALRLRGATSGYIELKAPASAGDNTLTLPTNDGVAHTFLKTDGSGNLSWQSNLTFDGTNLLVNGTMLNAVQLKFGNSGTAYIDHNIVGQDFYFRVGNSSALDTSALVIKSDGKLGIGTTSPVGNLEVRGTKANLIVAKTGLTVKANSDIHTTYDLIQLGAGGGLASYSSATATADTHLVHNAYRSSGGAWQYKYTDTAMRLRMNSPGGTFIFDSAASGSAGTTVSFSEKLRITSDDVTSFGNASPNAWQTGGGYYNLQIGNAGYIRADTDASGNFFSNGVNLYRDNSGWKFIEDGRGTQISHGTGDNAITFYGTNSGDADGTPTFFEMLKLQVNGDVVCGSGNLVLTDGQGISFAADGNAGGMTSELLDDYEEGTWTPTMATSNGNLTATYTVQTGTYTKVGRLVYVMFDITVSDTPTGTAGHPQIRGLPFTPVVGQSGQGGYPIPQFRDSSAMPVDARLYNSSYGHSSNTAIWLQYYNSSGVIQQPSGGTWWAQGRCQGELVYYAT